MTAILLPTGLLCAALAAYHGYLGQTRLIDPATFESRQAKALVGMIWQFSATAWVVCGLMIAAAPWLFDDNVRPVAVILACLPIMWGVVGNAWVTRGRHLGWKLFAAVIAAATAGALL